MRKFEKKFQSTTLTWLWDSLDHHAKKEYATLKHVNETLINGEKLEIHSYPTIVPFLQPTLEIMSGQDSHYLDGTSFATEVESLWAWLDRARDWCTAADELCAEGRMKYAQAGSSVMAQPFLNRLFSGCESHKDRQQLINGIIQQVHDECQYTRSSHNS
ncbi:hypothetical protein GCK32_022022 [Trichostrongylus colubriformis]|uniref:Uncharacterized protein n=1 Tax=Trichostrongylus colubriformis TaxID=6319 RepID=A0AAN8IGK1_TRICO